MTKNIRLLLKSVLVAIAITQLISAARVSAAYTVGVKTGDWVKYGNVSASWTGTGTEPSDITDLKQTEWMRGEVQSVSGTSVALRATTHYKNGTEKTETASGDVATASGNITMMIIPAGLKKGDTIPILFGTSTVTIAINDTTTRTYAGASRSVNLLNMSSSYGGFSSKVTVYWDQATGVLLELFMYQSMFGQTMQQSFKVTETNMWSPDILGSISGNLIYIIGIAVLVLVIFVGVFLIRRRKPTPTMTPAPTTVEETKSE